MNNLERLIKRVFDILLACVGLFLCLPLFMIIAILIKIDSPGPVLFSQERPGLRGEPFFIYKFRTMKEIYDESGLPLPDEQRLTKLGCFLRRTSIDELPELINVLKGDMSLVGPRPLLMEYLDLYTTEQARRHDVKPGITGWVQVNGRNTLTWDEKFELDIWYVDNYSLWLDIKILWMTLIEVLRREGISADGHATMPKFMGSGKNEYT
ncbi:MAG TPA: sugar transferase [Clostridiaceae bacterium]|nr:sugar transferase [Clostridiaceae bacterium]